MKALHVGDEVSFLGREGHGKIIKISSNQFLIEDDLGFETWIEKSEVIARLDFTIKLPEPGKKKPEKKVKVSNPKPTTDQVNWETPKIKIKKVKKPVKESDLIFIAEKISYTPTPTKTTQQIPEIDLHFHQLVENEKKYNDHEKLEIQLERLRDFIDDMLGKNQPEFIVIHGVGSGKLKNEIRNYINGHQHLHYEDASFKKYGTGATHVFVRKQRKKYNNQ
jgi:dsDNA-specific endonuclease/ATPase MutS2